MTPCHICGEKNKLSQYWTAGLVKCGHCGMVYTDPQPTFAELEKIYADEDYFRGLFYTDYVGDEKGFELNFRHRLETILQYAPTGGKLFEAGCAFGFFLKQAQHHWSEISGVDMSPDAVQYSRDTLGFDVTLGDFESRNLEPNSYDAVVMFDAIEHMYDPALAIKKSAEALRPGGIVALTTGDIGMRWAQWRGKNWRLIIPQHLFYFSEESLRYLLKENNLELVHFSHPGNYRSLGQYSHIIAWRAQADSWRVKLAKQIQQLPLMDVPFMLNFNDIMFAI
ncbi:MAG: class I SAM-dependent methyltransferase, partial [Chloroflexota bacterium]